LGFLFDYVEDVGGLVDAELAQALAPGRPGVFAESGSDCFDHVPILEGRIAGTKKSSKKFQKGLAGRRKFW
jgi:hypothetical protein